MSSAPAPSVSRCYPVTSAAAAVCLLLPLAAVSQAPSAITDAALQTTLAGLDEQARVYLQTMPNYTCDETIRAEEIRAGVTRRLTEAKGSFRVLRDPGGGWPKESRQILEENGKPLKEGKKAKLPVVLKGGFGTVLPLYFAASRHACFHYALEPGRVSFAAVADVSAVPACAGVAPEAIGFASLDVATGAVSHVERTVPERVAGRSEFAAFSAVDFDTASVGDRRLQVPAHIRGEISRGGTLYRFDAHYTGCRLFTGKATLLPDNALQE